jgi:Ca2+ transporting ATPase
VHPQAKGVYEKVGEATETALTVLCEKLNTMNVDKSSLKKKELGTVCNQAIQSQWNKDFTLEFSRDRKSMSSYCIPNKQTKLGPGPKMFMKV